MFSVIIDWVSFIEVVAFDFLLFHLFLCALFPFRFGLMWGFVSIPFFYMFSLCLHGLVD